MKVCELIDLLNTFPPYLDVWVSDGGYAEGGTPLKSVEKISAWDAGIDGDEVTDEWISDDNDVWHDPLFSKDEYEHRHSTEFGEVQSKSIILIRSMLD